MRVGLSGHQHIPAEAFSYVKNGITEIVSNVEGGLVGVSALAAGADQLFASLVLEHGGGLHIIIPCHGYETRFVDPADLERYWRLRGMAERVETLEYPEPSEDAYLEAGRRVVDISDLLIAVWDGLPAKGKGGTGDVVQYARSRGVKVEVVWPAGVVR